MRQVSLTMCRILGGPDGWSLSAWLYELRLAGHFKGRIGVVLVDLLFLDDGHCRKAWWKLEQ